MSDGGLVHVEHKIERNSPDLIHGGFEDHQGGKCLASWFGHELGMTGPEFIAWCGIPGTSEVVCAWDEHPIRFRAEILEGDQARNLLPERREAVWFKLAVAIPVAFGLGIASRDVVGTRRARGSSGFLLLRGAGTGFTLSWC